MYARVSRYEVPAEMLDADVDGLDDTVAKIEAVPGSLGLYYLVDRENGRTMSITLWESEQAMLDSEAMADKLRSETSSAVEGTILSVEHYEVATAPERT